MENKDKDYKVVEKTNPLGKITYLAQVKFRILWFIPYWLGIAYYENIDTILMSDKEYNTEEEAEQAIRAYKIWIKNKTKYKRCINV